MQSGQVSIWAPIVVGIIGLIGVIAGQLVNAWREDRRWNREEKRDEVHWEREQAKDIARRVHESMIDWRERRLAIYSDYLAAVLEMIETMRALEKSDSLDAAEALYGQWEKQYSHCQVLSHSVRLVCTRSIRGWLIGNIFSLAPLIIPFAGVPLLTITDKNARELRQLQDLAKSQQDKAWPFYHRLVDLMRDELGVNVLEPEKESI
jgi:hypothetical protein